jgi:hypothetical protein
MRSKTLLAAALSATLAAGCIPVAAGAVAAAGVGVAAVPMFQTQDGGGGAAGSLASADNAVVYLLFGTLLFLGGSVALVAALI